MANKDDDKKPAEVKEAEQNGGQTFTPEASNQDKAKVDKTGSKCPDCDGKGIRNPEIDHQVCQTCQGTGKA